VSPINSRRKGKEGENEFIKLHLLDHWPEAKRNLDQHGPDKRDCVEVGGVHWQIKRTENLKLWAAIQQAESEARDHDLPIVAFRRSHAKWHCILEADELVPLLVLREAA
jgi:hypothetical protein